MISKKILVTHGAGFIGTNQVNKLKLGYKPQMKFEDGIEKTYPWLSRTGIFLRRVRSFSYYLMTKMIQIQFNTNN